jgi:hypothetical protein
MSGGEGARSGTGTGGANSGTGGGGQSGSKGSAAGRGAGGTSGAAGIGNDFDGGAEDAGPTGGAGESGSGGSGGSGGGGDQDQAATQCLNDAMAAGQTITDCERCLCQTGVCQTETNAIKDDVNANALVKCSQENMCSGQCCLCGGTCGLQNYGDGPCASEAKVAAGVAPNSDIGAALTVMQQCAESGPEDSACARAARLSACALSKCAAMCPNLPACQ